MSKIEVVKLPREAWPSTEELPNGNLRVIAETLGIDVLMSLYELFPKTSVYFGHFDRFLQAHRNSVIRQEFDHLIITDSARKAVAALARKYDLSDRWIWEIVGRPDERQLGMWTK